MDFNELRTFKAIAEAGSVSRGAERLNCVQSDVTAQGMSGYLLRRFASAPLLNNSFSMPAFPSSTAR